MTFATDESKSGIILLNTHLLAEKNYWIRKIKSCQMPVASLRLDFPRPVVFNARAASIDFSFDGEIYQNLRELSGNSHFLTYTALLATLKIALHKCSGEEVIIVGSPARRYGVDASPVVNALPIIDSVDPELSFREFLLSVRQTLLEGYEKQHYPFEQLIRDLELESTTNKCALFDVALSLVDIHEAMPEVREDLLIRLRQGDEQLQGSIEFNSSLYETKTVSELLKYWRRVLTSTLGNTEIKIRDVSLLNEIEREEILYGWNETAREYPREQCIQQLFEAQVERTPSVTAVISGERELSYVELNERANQLAHWLRAQGVRAESRVGICLERSEWLIVGLLGILKAGGTYVPLDPQYPAARLSYMLADAGVTVLLTESSLRETLALAGEIKTLCLDSEWDELAVQPRTNPVSSVSAANLAYLIYTSGSTGEPKGIGIAHYSVNRLVCNSDYVQVQADDCIAQASNASFDAATFEIWGALLNGARLSIIPTAVVLSPVEFAAALQREKVTVLFLTTALFNQMAREAVTGFSGLRHLLFGGQAVEPQWVAQVLESGYAGRLLHVYGPTESTTYATWEEVKEVKEGTRSIPIGKPLANTTQYVLGAGMEVAPVGVVGELYLGGEGLARGYWERPELTAERFVPNPYGQTGGERLYRTGDLVRGVGDGRVEFVGRVDQQVKIRGFRVELEEVGVVLSGAPGVATAVVEVRGREGGEPRLVGYVVPKAEAALVVNELREYLQERLPAYMVPSVYVELAELPLTVNGKVDRRALPEPEEWGSGVGEYVAPRTATEEIVAGIWASVLKVERVGVTENFFDLGGHSLLATQVMSRIRESFAIELALLELFENPTVEAISKRIEEAAREGEGLPVPPLMAVEKSVELPLSFAQQRLWFLNQLEPESAFYNMPSAMRLTGKLSKDALERSLNELVRRHEALRTIFPNSHGKPVQVIREIEPVRIGDFDLSSLSVDERESRVSELAAAEAQAPFDLQRGPLLRVTLVSLSATEHILLLTMHHIISDGWSIDVFIRELGTLYDAFIAGQPPRLEPLSLRYADYACWQIEWLQGEVLERQLDYWKNALANAPAVLDLPTDKKRPAVQAFRGALRSRRLPEDVSKGLRELSQRQGVTLFMTLLAAFDVLIYRYSGQEDFCVGSPVANRNRSEIEGLIGFFVNTLVLRANLSGELTFKEALARVREVTLGAYAHQDIPFERLVEELQPERALSHSPLFQVMFVVQNTPIRILQLRNLTLSPVEASSRTAKFDLVMSAIASGGGLVLSLEYSTDLFEGETIERMLEHYERLLGDIVLNAEERLSRLELLSATERVQLLVEFNNTGRAYPREQCIQQLFEAQVERTPSVTAVMSGERELSYVELNERANQLAHWLRAQGVRAESRVGICLERSEWLIVGLLGILKAGGTYVPLDPQYPAARLSYMLADAGVTVLLTENSLRETLGLDGEIKTLCLDSEWDELAAQPRTNPESVFNAANLAYLIYTSGSTGEPKGIGIAHYSVNRLVCNSDYVQVQADDCIAQASNASFDAATFEIWGALLNGARLSIIPTAVVLSPVEFAAALQREKVTVLFLTTALFNQMAREAVTGFSGLRHLLFGGQAVEPQWVAQVLESGYAGRLLHVYGPTESTTYATWEEVKEVKEGTRSIPIGKPLANTTQYVLGAGMEVAPVGVVGELYLGGEGLARGYWERPELTAERFVPNPYSRTGGERLYRTGDLVRGVGEGRVEFVGRVDQQVKIRGFRVELEEVGVVLSSAPGVATAVVEVRGRDGGEPRLVGYVVPKAEAALVVSELREYLQERLPAYMVPSVYVELSELPLTVNGKVDRRALPEPEEWGSGGGEYVGPRTATEEIVAGIWASVLKVERVGVTENFFEIGGHSLLATQVMSRLRESFGLELALRELFEHATVAGLAARVDEALQGDAGVLAPPIVPVDHSEPLPLSFAQQRLWFLDQLQPGSGFYNVPAALRLSGELNVAALGRSLTEIVRRHEALRTVFESVDGEPVQVIRAAEPVVIDEVDLIGLVDREAAAQESAAAEAAAPFDLSSGPLLRVKLLRLGVSPLRSSGGVATEGHPYNDAENVPAFEQVPLFEYVLLVTMHHIISDGWSIGVLMRELRLFYEAYSRGAESPLEELPIQYADYAVWQREWLRGEVLERQLAYWREQLAGAPAVLELPADRPRPAVQSYRGAVYTGMLDAELSEALRELSRREGVTLYMTMLAAFAVLLSRYSGQEDICVGTALANRTRAEVEGLIGFFVNTLVLRTQLQGRPSFRELLGRVREVSLGGYAHQDVPFEKLVEELQPVRALSHAPLFQVMLNLQQVSGGEAGLAGLELGALAVEGRAARFDLLVSLNESGGAIAATVEYSTDLFEEARIARLLEHYETLLAGIVAQPEELVTALPLLLDAEREQLLVAWNATARAYERERCLHEWFEAQVERTPAATAVIFEERELSYAELNERANALALRLRQLGVGVESRVGLCVARTERMVVGLLGILKAGAAYVALDPQYPAARLQFMVADAGVSVLVTERGLDADLTDKELPTIYLDQEWELLATGAANLSSSVSAGNVAYIIYTSGSTGVPKGVAITHGSAGTLLQWAAEHYDAEALSGVLLATSICFDLSVYELFVPLSWGGRVIVAENVLALPQLAKAQEVKLVNTVPSVLTELERSGGLPESVTVVNLAGEALPVSLVQRLYEREHIKEVWNLYGPTEDTTYSTGMLLGRSEERAPIGQPLANTRAYVVDRNGELTPLGVAGELYLGGEGLARGYWQRAALTAERFVPDGFSGLRGERLYRTGDLVRWSGAGELEYLGRLDQQVKVRGYRIELGEMEAVLGQHEEVREAVVVLRSGAEGGPQLVGYVVAEEGVALERGELREYLRERLPEHLVPSLIVMLAELPLTANGKVDRRALASAVVESDEERYVEPRTATEELVAGIWAGVLRRERVGVTDNFFELGGHSLLATQVVSRVRESFGVELALRELFEHTTVAALAQRIDEGRGSEAGLVAPPIVAVQRGGALPLSFAQQRLWFLDQLQPESGFYNIPSAVRLSGVLNVAALERSLSEIVRRHEALRTVFESVDGEPVQVIREAAPLQIEEIDLSQLAEGEREAAAQELAAVEAQAPFDLSRGPLLRVKLLRLGVSPSSRNTGGVATEGHPYKDSENVPAFEQVPLFDHVLLVTMHHIISDGWSIGVLIRELTALYEAYSRGAESPLEELPIQYADYAVWQREWLQGEVLEAQMNYWRAQLATAPTALELPTDHVRPALQSYRGAAQNLFLPLELSNGLKELSRREGATLFMTLLAAFEVLLYRYSGQEDFCVGTPIANRNRGEIEGLIGFFVNTLVLRADLSGAPNFTNLLAQVRNVALDAYAHQDVPFEQLVEELQPERVLSQSPLFQVMFFIQNTPMGALELADITLQPVATHNDNVKFDLALIMQETNSGLVGRLEYSTDLFEHSTITRLINHFQMLLDGIVADPDSSVMSLPLLTSAERELLLADFIDVKEYRDSLIHDLFETQAAKAPEFVALSLKGKQINYAELNTISNQLAHGLVQMGVEAGQHVPVLLEDGVLQVQSMLAILKAGAVFVCLDPFYPPARVRQLLAELNAPCIISEANVLAKWKPVLEENDLQIFELDPRGAAWLRSNPTHNPGIAITPDAPAYIVFTSGSTGKPKGIVQSHRSFCQFLTWQSETFQIHAPSRIAQWASTIYDASYCEIFGTLCFGATLCLTTPLERHDPFAVVNWINEDKITLLQIVPSFCRQLLQVLDSSSPNTHNPFPTLKHLLLAGEVLPADLVAEWFARFDQDIELYNLYGPSETILATSFQVKQAETQNSIPIGKAIDGRQILILDQQQQLCPLGIKGEIYVRSRYLTLGYFKRPDETQRVFIQNPLHNDYPDPVYRTGDLGRWLADGNIEFYGRRDNQVKIRGMRVELEEIESALLRFPAISECVVAAPDYGDGDRRLLAYLVLNAARAEVEDDALESLHVSQYQDIYDEIYSHKQHYADYDPGLNLRIWVNSYTGQPFSKEEIAEGLEDTVQRIMSLQPRDVLDIGCGSGLLLFKIAPHCRSYVGTDISKEALQYLDHQLSLQTPKLSGVRLSHQPAHDFTGIEPGSFDCVIINDVHIYFPSIEYFVKVLEGAVKAVKPGGSIFIGGVRSLPLLKAFHTSVELYRASASLSKAALRDQVRKRIELDKELVIDPSFFTALQTVLPEIKRVDIQLKGGRIHNEVTRFQYDVVLQIGSTTADKPAEVDWLNWQEHKLNAAGMRSLLEQDTPELFAVRGVLNARVAADVKAVELLESEDGPETASELRQALQEFRDGAVDPEDLWTITQQLPYEVEVSCDDSPSDQYNVLFRRKGADVTNGVHAQLPAIVKPWSHYANNPMKAKLNLQLEPQLRTFLKESLPDHLVPATFVVMETLPRTRTGKVDRKNLPQPQSQRSESGHEYVAPQTEVELVIAQVWQKLLRVDRAGVNDNFFELGGHSLLATQVINKLRETYSIELPLRTIFESPTIAGLAAQVEVIVKQKNEDAEKLAQIIKAIKDLSPDQAAAEVKALKSKASQSS